MGGKSTGVVTPSLDVSLTLIQMRYDVLILNVPVNSTPISV